MPTLILSPRYTHDSRSLAQAARTARWEVRRLVNRQPPHELSGESVAIYGESFFVEYMAQELNVRLATPDERFLITVPDTMVLREIALIKRQDWQPLERPMFIKAAEIKSIVAKVYQPKEVILGLDQLPLETMLLVAEPVQWLSEYRCFIAHQKLQAMSIYQRDGRVVTEFEAEWDVVTDHDAEAVAFIDQVLQDTQIKQMLPSAVVIDIGFIADRGWAIIEANPVWASGIYGCDPQGVLTAVQASQTFLAGKVF